MLNDPRTVVLGYYSQVWDAAQPEKADDFFAPTYVNHAGSRGTMQGAAGIKGNYAALMKAFPDTRFTLDDVLVEGDKVVVRYTMHATHQGPFQGVAASGKAVTVPGIGIYRVADGLIQESWVMRDSLALLKQIGATSL